MRESLYIPLRDKIAAIVPEIMELKFGCRVSFSGHTLDYVGDSAAGNPMIHFPFAKMVKTVDPRKSKFAVINVGRDIQLADVLRAVETSMPCVLGDKWVDMASDGWMFLMFKNGDGHKTFRSSVKWELQLALHEQSDELGEWLLTIIK